jgi:hypothetical protein
MNLSSFRLGRGDAAARNKKGERTRARSPRTLGEHAFAVDPRARLRMAEERAAQG